MATVRDIVTDALREIGVLAAGEVASSDEELSGMAALNRLVDQWAAERLMIYQVTRTTFAIVSGTQTYTVGPSGNANRSPVSFLDHVTFYDNAVSPIEEAPLWELTDEAWANIPLKTLTSAIPAYYYFQPTTPTGALKLWPVPTGATLRGVVYSPDPVAEFSNLSTVISLPPGYRRMMVKNLAVECCPSFERVATKDLSDQAHDSKSVVKQKNVRLRDMSIDAAALGSSGSYYDIRLG